MWCKQMRADGIEEAAVICMAPQNSRTSVGLYRRAVEAEAGNLRIDFTAGWAQHPAAGRCVRGASAAGIAEAQRRGRRAGSSLVYCAQRAHPHRPAARRVRLRPAPVAGPGRRSLRGRGPSYRRVGGGSASRDSEVVVCFPKSGRKRWSVDRPVGRRDSGKNRGRRAPLPNPSAHRLLVRSC